MPDSRVELTPLQRTNIEGLIRQLRAVAGPVGPLHSWWDLIFDLEALLAGRQTFLKKTPEWFVNEANEHLAKYAARFRTFSN